MSGAAETPQAALNPHGSAWVGANAGAGKTYILVSRLVRLMLDGVAPEKLLCLTYTRAAAAETASGHLSLFLPFFGARTRPVSTNEHIDGMVPSLAPSSAGISGISKGATNSAFSRCRAKIRTESGS